jgi:uncharacterized protein YlxW (UPF0749 family)
MGAKEMTDPVEVLGLRLDDDDYRPSPPARWSQPYPGHLVLVLTALGALLVGFLIATGITTGRSAAQLQEERNGELIELINARQERVVDQAAQLEVLRADLSAAEAEVTRPTGLRAAVARAEQQAGLTSVVGPGLRITFDDAGSGCRGAQQQDCRIQDADLQLAVNTLFGLDAEAIALNGERVIATTAIRGAGRAILVNYRVLSPPFVLEAVGDQQRLSRDFPGTGFAQDFETWKSRYGLGFSYEPADDLLLPPYGGSLRFRTASVSEAQ